MITIDELIRFFGIGPNSDQFTTWSKIVVYISIYIKGDGDNEPLLPALSWPIRKQFPYDYSYSSSPSVRVYPQMRWYHSNELQL